MRSLRLPRVLLVAVLLVLVIQPVQARTHVPPGPATFTLFPETASSGDPLIGLIDRARTRVLVESYALNDQAIANALVAARGRGVDVRAMADPHSASSGALLDFLAAHDVWTRRGNPAFAITGQSAVVIDRSMLALSNAALTVQVRSGQLRFLLLDRDTTDVAQAASVFYDDWERRAPTRFGNHTVLAPPDYQAAAVALIDGTTRTLDIIGETLSSPAVLQAVARARQRHLRVRVLFDPGVGHEIVSSLLALGADTALMGTGFTGEALFADQNRLLIGSAALSDASLLNHRELGLSLTDSGVTGAFASTFESYWLSGTRIYRPRPTPVPIYPFPIATPVPPTPRVLPTRIVAHATPRPTPPPGGPAIVPAYNSSVRIGGRQVLRIQTAPGASVAVIVTYPDGSTHNQGTAQGTGQADPTGAFIDAWTVLPNAVPGTAQVAITVTSGGVSRTERITFRITY